MQVPSTAVALALTLAVALAACGTPTTTDAVNTTAPLVAVSAAGRPTDAQLAAFAKAFARKYPVLAAGRKRTSIAADAQNTCSDIARNEFTKAVLINRVQRRFGRDVESSAKTAAGILALLKKKACPPS